MFWAGKKQLLFWVIAKTSICHLLDWILKQEVPLGNGRHSHIPLENLSGWDMCVLEGLNQLTAMQNNGLTWDSIQGTAKCASYFHLILLFEYSLPGSSSLPIRHLIFLFVQSQHAYCWYEQIIEVTWSVTNNFAIWLHFIFFSICQTIKLHASCLFQFEYETSGKNILFLRIINVFSKIGRQLWQMLLWKSQLSLCFRAETLASRVKEELLCEECAFYNSCKNLSTFGLWNGMPCMGSAVRSESSAAQMPKVSVPFRAAAQR